MRGGVDVADTSPVSEGAIQPHWSQYLLSVSRGAIRLECNNEQQHLQRTVHRGVCLPRWLYKRHQREVSYRVVLASRSWKLQLVCAGAVRQLSWHAECKLQRAVPAWRVRVVSRTDSRQLQRAVSSGVLLSCGHVIGDPVRVPCRTVQSAGSVNVHNVQCRSIRRHDGLDDG